MNIRVPDPLGSLEEGLNNAKDKVGGWVSGAPGVASDAAEWVEGAEGSVGTGWGTAVTKRLAPWNV